MLTPHRADELTAIEFLMDAHSQLVETARSVRVRGTLKRLKEVKGGALVTATIDDASNDTSYAVDNFCAAIFTTRFYTSLPLAFESYRVKSTLRHDPTCSPAPVLLDIYFLSQDSSIPTLAIRGYPGARRPLFEMRARATVRAWTSVSARDHPHPRITQPKVQAARALPRSAPGVQRKKKRGPAQPLW
jgi:hypothetical protein